MKKENAYKVQPILNKQSLIQSEILQVINILKRIDAIVDYEPNSLYLEMNGIHYPIPEDLARTALIKTLKRLKDKKYRWNKKLEGL